MTQPAPTPNEHPPIWEIVIAEMKARDQLGRERYGTPLQAFNGRDALRDLFEELLDATTYVRCEMYEKEEQWKAMEKVYALVVGKEHLGKEDIAEVVSSLDRFFGRRNAGIAG